MVRQEVAAAPLQLLPAVLQTVTQSGLQPHKLFLTGPAAALSAKDCPAGIKPLQQQLLRCADTMQIQLLVCGRAAQELGLKPDDLQDGFILSGYMDMLASVLTADRVLEF